MRARFGERFAFGCAAENIIVEGAAPRVTPEEIAAGVVIELRGTRKPDERDCGHAVQALREILPPRAQRLPPEVVKSALQFLDHGMHGCYYCSFTGPKTATIHHGAKVFAV